MKKSSKRFYALILALIMATGLLAAPVSAAGFRDTQGHWAAAHIDRLVEAGIITGRIAGEIFDPEAPITRAEYARMVNNAFGFTDEGGLSFTDVPSDAWYAKDIAIAVKAGIFQGHGDGTVTPNAVVDRQSAATIAYRVYDAKGYLGGPVVSTLAFNDISSAAGWAQNSIREMAARGIIGGMPDGNYQPARAIKRAEAAAMVCNMLDNAASTSVASNNVVLNDWELRDTVVEGSLTVINAGTVVENVVVKGDLIIARSVGSGNVTLKGVTVEGNTYIRGGGVNSIIAIDSHFGTVYIDYQQGNVRFVVNEGSDAVSVVFLSNGKLEISDGGTVTTVTIPAELRSNNTIEVVGNVDSIKVEAPVRLTVDGNIGTLELQAATNLTIAGGEVGSLTVASSAAGANIAIARGAVVDNAVFDGRVTLSGSGTITTAAVNVPIIAPSGLVKSNTGSSTITAPSPGGGGPGGPSGPSGPGGPTQTTTITVLGAITDIITAPIGGGATESPAISPATGYTVSSAVWESGVSAGYYVAGAAVYKITLYAAEGYQFAEASTYQSHVNSGFVTGSPHRNVYVNSDSSSCTMIITLTYTVLPGQGPTDFSLGPISAFYNSFGVLTIYSTQLNVQGITADVSKIKLGGTAITVASPADIVFTAGEEKVVIEISNSGTINAISGFNANGTAAGGLVIDAGAFIRGGLPSQAVGATNVGVSGYASSTKGITSVAGMTLLGIGGGNGASSGAPITGHVNVPNGVTQLSVGDIVHTGASVILYDNAAFSNEASLELVANDGVVAYIKVTAVDTSEAFYAITVNRAGLPITGLSLGARVVTPILGNPPDASAPSATGHAEFSIVTWSGLNASNFAVGDTPVAEFIATADEGYYFDSTLWATVANTPLVTVTGAQTVGITFIDQTEILITVNFAAITSDPTLFASISGKGESKDNAVAPGGGADSVTVVLSGYNLTTDGAVTVSLAYGGGWVTMGTDYTIQVNTNVIHNSNDQIKLTTTLNDGVARQQSVQLLISGAGASANVAVYQDAVAITGSPAFDGIGPATFGSPMTVGVGNLVPSTGITFNWYRSGDASYDEGVDSWLRTGANYTPQAGDIGKYLIVVATSSDASGYAELASGVVAKATGPPPISSNFTGTFPATTKDRIDLAAFVPNMPGLEAAVAIDGSSYAAYAPLFVDGAGRAQITGLVGVTAATKVRVRVAETATHLAGSWKEITVTPHYTVVSERTLTSLVTAPVRNAVPDTTAINETQYTGTVAWYNNQTNASAGGNFAPNTVYRALVTLTAKEGYTFTGVPVNSFTYAGATSVTNTANSGTVTIVFQPTAAINTIHANSLGAITDISAAPVSGAAVAVTLPTIAAGTGYTALTELTTGAALGGANYVSAGSIGVVEAVYEITLTAENGYTFTGTNITESTNSIYNGFVIGTPAIEVDKSDSTGATLIIRLTYIIQDDD